MTGLVLLCTVLCLICVVFCILLVRKIGSYFKKFLPLIADYNSLTSFFSSKDNLD